MMPPLLFTLSLCRNVTFVTSRAGAGVTGGTPVGFNVGALLFSALISCLVSVSPQNKLIEFVLWTPVWISGTPAGDPGGILPGMYVRRGEKYAFTIP
jgi:hypothetical protein